MQPQHFIDYLKRRLAVLAIGPSTLRGIGTSGVAAAARRSLAAIELATLAVEDRRDFQDRLQEITKSVKVSLPKRGRAWGRARKAVNLFLRDVVYNADLRDHYGLQQIRPWLELPMDRQVATGLLGEDEGAGLSQWPGLKHLRPDVSRAYQTAALKVAERHRVCRVDLDVFYFRRRWLINLGPTPYGSTPGTGAASLDAVIADIPLGREFTEAEVRAEVRRRRLPERSAIGQHLRALKEREYLRRTGKGWVRLK
jgi:hypothetical protein